MIDWAQDRELGGFQADRVFFRLFKHLNWTFHGKRVLEVGFLGGADLWECHRQGALVHGIDINENAVRQLRHRGLPAEICNAARQAFPFASMDLIYSMDTIYYFSDAEIQHFIAECWRNLVVGGLCCVSIVEADYAGWTRLPTNFADSLNPFRFLDTVALTTQFSQAGFKLIARKAVIETYFVEEEFARHHRYLLFKKPEGQEIA